MDVLDRLPNNGIAFDVAIITGAVLPKMKISVESLNDCWIVFQ